jgi:hypothetical protein
MLLYTTTTTTTTNNNNVLLYRERQTLRAKKLIIGRPVKKFSAFKKPEASLPYSQKPTTGPYQ